MDSLSSSKPLRDGIERNAALENFRERCNKPETLFITDKWFTPRRERLLELLSDPISDEQAKALLDALHQRAHLDAVIEWLSLTTKGWFGSKPVRWEQYPKRNREAAMGVPIPWEDVDRCRWDTALQENRKRQVNEDTGEPVFDLDRLREAARPCPECGDRFDELVCFYYSTPSWTWQKMCGRAGWLVVCDRCHLQVQFFLHVMN